MQPPTRPPSLAEHPGYLAFQVGKVASRLLADELAPHDLRPTHLAVLAALSDVGPCCQRDLCDRLDVDKSHMVAFVDDLEDRGLLERQRDPEDRRRHRVAITEDGRTALKTLLAAQQRAEDALAGGLDPAQRAALVSLLARVVAAADHSRLGLEVDA